MQIGRHTLTNNLFLAPMAGVTDLVYRKLCRQLGAGYSVTEMISADSKLWHSNKSRLRRQHLGEPTPRVVQIVGSDPLQLAQAAVFNVEHGADIIDINMGCPAKKCARCWQGPHCWLMRIWLREF